MKNYMVYGPLISGWPQSNPILFLALTCFYSQNSFSGIN